jgi:site-specific DNA recombinase
VSTEEQVETGYSLAEQREACIRRAKELGATSITVYADEGVSGATLDRPGLSALRREARSGRIELVVCRDPDRLSRRLAHQLLLTEELERWGVRLEFISFEWKDTPEGRLFYAVRGAIAEYEREKIRERTTLGRLQKARQGGIPVGLDLYGYTYNPETGRVEVREEEVAVVREIFVRFAGGWGYSAIARWLNEQGVPTRRRKGPWHRQVVAQIIANSAYAGTWYYRRRDFAGGRRGQPVPPEHWIAVPVPALIPEDLWLAARQKAEAARRLWASRGKHDYLLSGLVTCGDCGLPMSGTWMSCWGKPDRRYTCRRHAAGSRGGGCRPTKVVLARPVEQVVWDRVKAWLGDSETLAREATSAWPDAEELRRELARVDRLLVETERGRQNVLAALAGGWFDLDARTRNMLAELRHRAERLNRRKKEIEAEIARGTGGGPDPVGLRLAAASLLAGIDAFAFEEKRELVRALVQQVVVTGRPRAGDACGDLTVTVVPRTEEAPDGGNPFRRALTLGRKY